MKGAARSGARRRLRLRTLSSQLLVGQVAVLLVATAVGTVVWAHALRRDLDRQYQQRALIIANATAAMPQIVSALVRHNPRGVEALAERIRRRTDAAYVVVIDPSGTRYSHPRRTLIGQRIEPGETVVAMDGHEHVRIDHGKLGPSANGRVPVWGPGGHVVGEVSAGVLERSVAREAGVQLRGLAVYLPIVLGVGFLGALLLARRLKRQTIGLELDEIAALVHEREATLHGIREAVLALDAGGNLTLLNEQAHELLGTSPSDVGRPAREVLAGSDALQLVPAGPDAANMTDLVTVHRGRMLVGSRRRVVEAGRELGHVITLRDRTELEHALRELDEVRGLIDALRAQQHEFSNRMHVLSGLLDLGRHDDAAAYAREVESVSSGLAAELDAEISDPRITALLVAKTTVARERGIALAVECAEPISLDETRTDALISIIGNLVDNAIDAVSGQRPNDAAPPAILVRLSRPDDDVMIEVKDTGPGIPPGSEEQIFGVGWSTKADDGRQRGIGLALVHQLVDTLGGSIVVSSDSGARFRVRIPASRVGARS